MLAENHKTTSQELYYYKVIIAGNYPDYFVYKYNEPNLCEGEIVKIDFRGKITTGIIISKYQAAINPNIKYKEIIEIIDLPAVPKRLLNFLNQISDYYITPKALVYSLILRSLNNITNIEKEKIYQINKKKDKTGLSKRQNEIFTKLQEKEIFFSKKEITDFTNSSAASINTLIEKEYIKIIDHYTDIEKKFTEKKEYNLSKKQQEIYDQINSLITTKDYFTYLLHGLTGSGKTLIYFKIITNLAKNNNGQYLLILPEISLGKEFVQRAKNFFAKEPVFWHSKISKKERSKIWKKIANGENLLIIGARSALFLPFVDLRLIIIDEEHETSYKQEETIRYNARDMAVLLAYNIKIPCLLISATPSLETLKNVRIKNYHYGYLDERYGKSKNVICKIINMVENKKSKDNYISETLREAVREKLAHNEQSLLYINRRGYAPLTICRYCGFTFKAPDTDSFLVEHRFENKLRCHLTGYEITKPKKCPKCESENSFISSGPAIEKIYDEAKSLFPEARIAKFSSDLRMIDEKEILSLQGIIEKTKNNEIDILVATQIAAKGYHFPHLTLVGIIDADMGINSIDLRANERMYQQLLQVTGRAGREEKRGVAYLQTYNIEHPVLEAIKNGNFQKIINYEMDLRERFSLPPFGRLIAMIFQGRNKERVRKYAINIKNILQKNGVKNISDVFEAPIFLIRNNYRYRLLIKIKTDENLSYIKNTIKKIVNENKNIQLIIDVDPYNFF